MEVFEDDSAPAVGYRLCLVKTDRLLFARIFPV